jgi:hypothetical protein
LKVDYVIIPILTKYFVAGALDLKFGPQIVHQVSAKAESGLYLLMLKISQNPTSLNLGAT